MRLLKKSVHVDIEKEEQKSERLVVPFPFQFLTSFVFHYCSEIGDIHPFFILGIKRRNFLLNYHGYRHKTYHRRDSVHGQRYFVDRNQ
jgi:hypothetical protein